MRALFTVTALSVLLISCAGESFKEKSDSEISHYIWSTTLVSPAIHAAMGPFDQKGLEEASIGLAASDREALLNISKTSFHPVKVYGKIQKQALQKLNRKELLALAEKLNNETWIKFADKLLYFYGKEGSEEVAQTMREIDNESYQLNMRRAQAAERLSRNSYNFHTVDILYTKMPGGSPVERFLYQQSLLVTTYLALKDLSLKEIRRLEEVRENPVYQKYKIIFETTVGAQYDEFFSRLQKFSQKNNAG